MKIFFSIFALIFSLSLLANEQSIYVNGMDCARCIEKVETALRKSSDVEAVNVFLDTGKVVIKTRNKKILSASLIERLITEAGYSLKKDEKKGT